MKTEEKTIG